MNMAAGHARHFLTDVLACKTRPKTDGEIIHLFHNTRWPHLPFPASAGLIILALSSKLLANLNHLAQRRHGYNDPRGCLASICVQPSHCRRGILRQ